MSLPAEVLAQVSSFMMLAPGTETSDKNMDTLLASITKNWRTTLTRATKTQARPMIRFEVEGKKKQRVLIMTVHEPFLDKDDWTASCQDFFYKCSHPATGAGLLCCLMEAKAALVDLNRGLCPECGVAEPPRKRLKGPGMPTCEMCCMLNAVGL
jgi:hypothetical protein